MDDNPAFILPLALILPEADILPVIFIPPSKLAEFT